MGMLMSRHRRAAKKNDDSTMHVTSGDGVEFTTEVQEGESRWDAAVRGRAEHDAAQATEPVLNLPLGGRFFQGTSGESKEPEAIATESGERVDGKPAKKAPAKPRKKAAPKKPTTKNNT